MQIANIERAMAKSIRSIRRVPLTNGADTLLCPANDKRIALSLLTAGVGGIHFLSPLPMTAISQGGVIDNSVDFNSGPWTVTLANHGALVQNEWHAWATLVNMAMIVCEVFAVE